MIWFDIKELERGLKSGDVSDKEIFNYLIATLIMFSIVPYIPSNDYKTTWLIAVEIVIVIAITIIGTKMTFDINSRGDNKDYFKRFLSLSFVTGIRLVVFVFLAAIPVGIIVYLVDKNIGANENIKDLFNLTLMTGIGVFYYFMLTNSFKRVSQ
jgi:hypothetical protein